MRATKSSSGSGRGRRLAAATLTSVVLVQVAAAQGQWHRLLKKQLPDVTSLQQSAALVDVDGDGDLDLIIAEASSPVVRVFANEGSGRFASQASSTASANGYQMTTGDVDGDGDLDLITMDGVLVNAGTGTLTRRAVSFGVVHDCADLDGDGRDDIVSAVAIWRSLPGGAISPQPAPAMPANVVDAAAADLDGDGDLDLVLGLSNTIQFGFAPGFERVWRNDGPAGFTDVSVQWFPGAVDDATARVVAGDLDGDGDCDCAIGNGSTWKLRRNDGTGVLSAWTTVTGLMCDRLVDLDGDGDLDFPGASSWLRNDGGGAFSLRTSMPAGQMSLLAVGDVDGDGRPDLFGLQSQPGIRLRLLLNRLPNPFIDSLRDAGIPIVNFDTGIAAGDADGDGDIDLVRPGGQLNLNDGSGWTTTRSMPWGPNITQCAFADVDQDGDQDLVGIAFAGTSRTLLVVRNNGGAFSVGNTLPVQGDVVFPFDADGDGDQDIMLAGMQLLRNDGTGAFTPDPVVPVGGALCRTFGAADFDGDGDLDILAGDTRLQMFVNDGSGRFTWTPTRLGVITGQVEPLSILPFDADGDGDLDAFVSQYLPLGGGVQALYLLRNIGGGSLIATTGMLPPAHGAAGHARVGDVDGDGAIDVVVSTTNGIRYWRNDGTGRMADIGAVGSTAYPREPMVLADLDGDLDLDVVIGDCIFLNRQWHAYSPHLVLAGQDDVVRIESTDMPNSLAIPFVGTRARLLLPPFGTIGLDHGSATPLPLTNVSSQMGELSIRIPGAAVFVGLEFGVQAILTDGNRYHLTPTVYDVVR